MNPRERLPDKVTDLVAYRSRKHRKPPASAACKSPYDRILDEIAQHLLMAARAIEAGRL